MAKRFIDNTLFKKQSFKELQAPFKLLWIYINCECNHAGVWDVELNVASLRLGIKLGEDTLAKFSGMVKPIDGGEKWWVKDFIRFQYGGELVTGNKMHQSVIAELGKWGLLDELDDVEIVEVGTTKNAMRERLGKKARMSILVRDEMTCQYCSIQRPLAELVVDHIVPINKMGDNGDENLCASCVRCNSHKTDILLDEFVNKGHSFLNLTERVKKRLIAPYKPLQGAKEKEKDMEKDQDMVLDKEQEQEKVEGVQGKPKNRVHEPTIWPSFDDFYNLYDRKRGRPNAETEWAKLSQADHESIMAAVPAYIANSPKEYRKDPERYLKLRTWEDEIISRNGQPHGQSTAEQRAENYKRILAQRYPDR